MCTRISVQIKLTEIESKLFSNIFQWRNHVLDKEGDAGDFPPPFPPKYFCYIAYTVFYHVLSIIKLTEIESKLFSNIFEWRIHALDKEGDAGDFSPPPSPQNIFVILPTLFL